MRFRAGRTIAQLTTAAMVSAAVVGAGMVGTVLTAAPASASTSAVSTVASMTNAARSSHGLRGYQHSADVAAVAQRWADQMASQHGILHNPNLRSAISGWRYVGENVGNGGSLQAIQSAFMKSPTHRSNILDGDYTQMGVGVAVDHVSACDCDVYYIVVDFRQPKAAASNANPAPKPAPTTQHQPAPPRKPASTRASTPKQAAAATTPPPPASTAPVAASPSASPTPTAGTADSSRNPVTRALEFTAS